jgi:hypothetical protein
MSANANAIATLVTFRRRTSGGEVLVPFRSRQLAAVWPCVDADRRALASYFGGLLRFTSPFYVSDRDLEFLCP